VQDVLGEDALRRPRADQEAAAHRRSRMFGKQPIRDASAEIIEFDALDDAVAVRRALAVLVGVDVVRLEDLQLQRNRQPALDGDADTGG
jgi:hypothetical protein